MEFWGVEVKSGEPLKVKPGDGMVLHLSQACLGELKKEKGNEAVYLSVNVKGQKLVLGTLFTDRLPQLQFDLVFDKDFEISHNWKKGSVYFYGYKCNNPEEENEFSGDSDESESEDDIPLARNGKPDSKSKQEKPVENKKVNAAAKDKDSDAKKQKVKVQEPKENVVSQKDADTSEDDFMSEDDDSMSEDDEESGESDEETPVKAPVLQNKKRSTDSSSKTPVQSKKLKATPQKTDGKKAGVHVATPYPSKQPVKKTSGEKQNNTQAQKSGGAHHCSSCNRTFASDKALESHNNAKHAGGK